MNASNTNRSWSALPHSRTHLGVLLAAVLALPCATAPIHGQSRSSERPTSHPQAEGNDANKLPHLETRGKARQLIVDGKPFLILGGELHNSSSSSLSYMGPLWPRLAQLHLNTVLLPVAWETIEPEEGRFDFTVVDGLLDGARQNHLHLVLLWFGAWKNTFSSYVPAYVKRDPHRFPRVQTSDGRNTMRLSPFSETVRSADARAFARLMDHIKASDGVHRTVLMVQVENEVGVIPQSRDHAAVAERAFAASVPSRLMTYLASHRSELNPDLRATWENNGGRFAGTWQEIFGTTSLTDDLFMAWQYATYTEQVAAAGKGVYSLPMYTNAALIRPNYEPGQYNSGGPLPHSMDIWRAGAPSLDFFAPDIYFKDFAHWATLYARPSNPLFVPEAQGGSDGAANVLYALGRRDALGFSAFGIDDEGNAPLDLVGITQPGEQPDNKILASVYEELSSLGPALLEAQQHGSITAVTVEGEAQRAGRVKIGDYVANITRATIASGQDSRVGALFLQEAPDQFLVIGAGDAQVTFSSDSPSHPNAEIESIDELFVEQGKLAVGRRLNGDESSQGQALRLRRSDPGEGRIYRVRLYSLP